MKKIILILIALMSFAFLSCSQKEEGPVKIVLAGRGGTHIDAMKSVLSDFEQKNNVTVEILALESANLKQKIGLDAGNKTASYDLIMADDPWMPEFCEAGLFAPLEDYGITKDPDIIPAAMYLGTYPYKTGKLYALPVVGNVQLFFYNQSLYNQLGLSLPQSWEEVLNNAKAIKDRTGKPGYAIRGQQGNPIVSDYLPVLWAMGGEVFNKDWTSTINSTEGQKALDFYKELLATGVNLEKNDLVQAVSKGDAGMSLGWPSWYIAGAEASAAYGPIPNKFTNASSAQSTGMIGNWMMGITANSGHKAEAAAFLSYLTSSDVQKKMATQGGIPTRKSVYEDSALVAKYPHYTAQLAALENSVARPRTPKWSEVEAALGAELSAAIVGTKTTEEALSDAQDAINSIMK
ncbi:extracellular solute-binding protein [Spirochaeta cellobiosiphila]|uniref:extracellular solute-binding protein n=1 Tax=Spirochaeta cellobiosiphila TaxID=504483 RepID=UPI00042852AA|nr:extracellular solute-binding protein [Spirochaeta cellobiosiphila]